MCRPRVVLRDYRDTQRLPVIVPVIIAASEAAGERSGDASKPHVCVVLEGSGHRPVHLGECRRASGRKLVERRGDRVGHERVGLVAQVEAVARQTIAADDPAGSRGKAHYLLPAPAAGTACQLGQEAGREQQLQPEGEQVCGTGRRWIRVEQLQLPAEQVVGGDVRLSLADQAQKRLAGAGRRAQRGAVLAQAGIALDRLRPRDGVQLSPALVEDQPEAEERLEPAAKARSRAADSLRDSPDTPARARIQVQNAIRLTEANRAQHDGFGLVVARHGPNPFLPFLNCEPEAGWNESAKSAPFPPVPLTTLAAMEVLTGLDERRIRDLLARDEFFWLDLTGPSDADIETLARLFELDELALDDMHDFSHERARLHTYGDYMLLVYFAAHHEADFAGEAKERVTEVHLLVSGGYVATVHHRPVADLEEQQRRIERMATGTEESIVFTILDALTDTFFPVLSKIGDEIDDLEEDVLRDATAEQLEKTRHVKRELIFLRSTINSQRDLFGRVTSEIEDLPGLEADEKRHYRNTYDHLIRLSELVDNYRELLTGVRDIYVSTVSNRLNEIMKRLTVVATLFLPLTFLTGFFGQNFDWLTSHDKSFSSFLFLGLGLLLVSLVGFWIWFRRSRVVQ
jgi:magnesium transporter